MKIKTRPWQRDNSIFQYIKKHIDEDGFYTGDNLPRGEYSFINPSIGLELGAGDAFVIMSTDEDDKKIMEVVYKAIKDYKPDKQNSFKSFANLCIERQLITAIKSSNRQKHMPLNSYLSLNMTAFENEDGNNDTQIVDVLENTVIEDPLDTITKKEYFSSVENVIDSSLSDFEKKVLNRYVQGESYVKIAERLDAPVKSVDNAIQRIRKKTAKNIQAESNI